MDTNELAKKPDDTVSDIYKIINVRNILYLINELVVICKIPIRPYPTFI